MSPGFNSRYAPFTFFSLQQYKQLKSTRNLSLQYCSTQLPLTEFLFLYLQVFNQLGSLLNKCDISIHLVEVSPKLSEIQALTLTGGKIQSEIDVTSPVYMKGISKAGIPIFWYRELQDVPQGSYDFTVTMAFFTHL